MHKFLGENNRIYISIDKAGANANKVSPVWNMGFHVFNNDARTSKTFRLVFLKTKRNRYFCEASFDKGTAETGC